MIELPALFPIVNGQARRAVLEIVSGLPLGTHKVLVAPLTAEDALRKRFHAMVGDVARQAQFRGRWMSPQQWKVLLISGHAVACHHPSELISGLEDELVDIRESTTTMGHRRLSSCVEYTRAWGDLRGMRWSEPKTARNY